MNTITAAAARRVTDPLTAGTRPRLLEVARQPEVEECGLRHAEIDPPLAKVWLSAEEVRWLLTCHRHSGRPSPGRIDYLSQVIDLLGVTTFEAAEA